jgi:hypothetical protein
MNLIAELKFPDSNTSYTLATFTHRILPNNTVNYYINDDRGISIYDQDWNFIRRINAFNPRIPLYGKMFINDEFIYIGNCLPSINIEDRFFLKLDFDLKIINHHYFPFSRNFFVAFDSCNKRFFLLWSNMIVESVKIHLDVYNMYLRKTSEINTTSINNINNHIYADSWFTTGLGFFRNQLYISYKNFDLDQYIMVTDINGRYITTYSLILTFVHNFMNPFTFDNFGNILFTSMGQLCLHDTFLNKTKKCIVNMDFWTYIIENQIDLLQIMNDYPLYAQVDQSGRLIAIDSFKKKIKLYY